MFELSSAAPRISSLRNLAPVESVWCRARSMERENSHSPEVATSLPAHNSDALVHEGMRSFRLFRDQQLCGSRGGETYERGFKRPKGPKILIGAIIACMQNGLVHRDQIVAAAARVAGTRKDLALTILDIFSGSNPVGHFWVSDVNGVYRPLRTWVGSAN